MTGSVPHAGRRIRARREALGLSVEDLAQRIAGEVGAVRGATLSKYEEAETPPHRGATRLAISRALETEHDTVFGEEPLTVRLEEAMARAEITDEDVQRDLGISVDTLDECRAGTVLNSPSARRDLAHVLDVPHDELWPRSPLPPGLPRLADGRRKPPPAHRRTSFSAKSQAGRVLTALRGAGPRGLTAVDFLGPEVIDRGPPILRLPARIDELRQAGCVIDSSQLRGKVAVYRLIKEPSWPGRA